MLRQKITAAAACGLVLMMMAGMFLEKGQNPPLDFFREYRNTVPAGAPLLERITGAIAAFDRTMTEDTWRREDFNELFGLVQKIQNKHLLQDPNYGEIYKTAYGQIIFAVKEKDVTPALDSTEALKRKLDEAGIPLLYVQAPFKVSETEETLPNGIRDYADANADRFLAGLGERNIDFLDLRPLLRDGTKNQKELFFDTDHHWRIETAFDATWAIGRELNRNYGFSIDPALMDPDSYHYKLYPACFQGSMGRRTGVIFGGMDDFTLITPAFPTDLTVEERDGQQPEKTRPEELTGAAKALAEAMGVDTEKEPDARRFEGPFDRSMVRMEYLDPEKPADTNRYAVYRGDYAELVIRNNLPASGRVLIIKDSFGIPVYTFLGPAVRETIALDMRFFKGDVAGYAAEVRPDVVLILYNADTFGPEMFNFNLRKKEGEET